MSIKEYFTKTYAPRWIILQIDILLSLMALLWAYTLSYDFEVSRIPFETFKFIIPVHIFFRVVLFRVFRVYRGITRYTGVQDAKRLFYAISIGSFVYLLISLFAGDFDAKAGVSGMRDLPVRVVLIDYLGALVLLTSFRIGVKIVFNEYSQRNQGKKRKILIFGAGRSGIITKRTIDHDNQSRVEVAAFLDDNKGLHNKFIDGVKVLPFELETFEKLVDDCQASELIISVQDFPSARKQEIIDACIKKNLKTRIVPPANKWINGELSLQQIKKVNIEDLLERDPIVMDTTHIEQDVKNKTVLVTGAAGSIGSEMVRQLVRFYPSLIVLLDSAETPLAELKLELEERFKFQNFKFILSDVRNRPRLEQIFNDVKPEVVYHVAAYKHVPMMEENVSQAITTNVLGTKNVADLASIYGAKKFVMISTDKAVNPTNVMGASKRMAEIYVQSLNEYNKSLGRSNTQYITTRFGNVLGSNGSVIPRFKRQIDAGGPITVTHPEITRYFMTIPEACQLILEAGTMGKGGEIFIFDMGKDVKIVDLAKKMIKLSGFEPEKEIRIEFTGLRPGEKIREELLNEAENTLPTHHKKIMIAKVRSYDFETVEVDITGIIDLAKGDQEFDIVAKMKEIVPEFRSNNSKFSILDKPKEMHI